MSQEIELAQAGPVARQAEMAAPTEGAAFLSMIERAARDTSVDVSKMQQLMEMRERWEARQAEAEFNRDFAAAMLEMPRVVKRGKKDMGGKGVIAYETYEDLDGAIRPIEARYGFARSFLTREATKPGTVMTLRLTHRAGHSITSERFCPPDPGPGRNETQALGSGDSYGRRYLTKATWNIVTIGHDDDGDATSYITKEQYMVLNDLVQDCQFSPARIQKILEWQKADKIDHIQESHYKAVKEFLEEKLREKGGAR